jgi:hypothetical protein
MILSLASQARRQVDKVLLRFPGCESRYIRGLTGPAISVWRVEFSPDSPKGAGTVVENSLQQ